MLMSRIYELRIDVKHDFPDNQLRFRSFDYAPFDSLRSLRAGMINRINGNSESWFGDSEM